MGQEPLGTGKGLMLQDQQVDWAWERRKASRGAKKNPRLVILQTAHCHLAHQEGETPGHRREKKGLDLWSAYSVPGIV